MEEEQQQTDSRKTFRFINVFVLIIGCSIGIYGLVDAIIEVASGEVKIE
jgi:hypothetical protein